MKKQFVLISAILILLCPMVSAQTLRGAGSPEWELSFFAGMADLGETSSSTPIENSTAILSSSMEPDSGLLLGARVTQNLGRHFAAEMDYTFADHSGTFLNPTPSTSSLEMDQTTHSFFYNILFYLRDSSSRLRPYVSGGGGATYFALDGSIKSTSEQLGFNMKNSWELGLKVGAGVKYRLNEKIGVRADFTDQISDSPSYGLPSVVPVVNSVPGAGYAPSGTLHNMHVSFGLIYYPEG